MFFRKKPVIVEAYKVSQESTLMVAHWCHGEPIERMEHDHSITYIGIRVHTNHGTTSAWINDWVVKAPEDFYPCSTTTFEAFYEPLASEDQL